MSAQPPEADTGRAVSAIISLGIDRIGLNGQGLQDVTYGRQPRTLISSRDMTITGAGVSRSSLLIRDPVTVMASSS